ncbi:hypothetical protein D9M68_631440 [compost metagenome]
MDHRIHNAQADTSLDAAGLADRLFQRLHGVEHAFGVFEHLAPLRRQRNPLRIAQKKTNPQLVFQRGDAAGNRGLGAEQLFRREAKALQPCDPDKGLEKSQIHGYSALVQLTDNGVLLALYEAGYMPALGKTPRRAHRIF